MNIANRWNSIQKRGGCSFLKMSSYCNGASQPQTGSTYGSSCHVARGLASLGLPCCPVPTCLSGQGFKEGSRWQVSSCKWLLVGGDQFHWDHPNGQLGILTGFLSPGVQPSHRRTWSNWAAHTWGILIFPWYLISQRPHPFVH